MRNPLLFLTATLLSAGRVLTPVSQGVEAPVPQHVSRADGNHEAALPKDGIGNADGGPGAPSGTEAAPAPSVPIIYELSARPTG